MNHNRTALDQFSRCRSIFGDSLPGGEYGKVTMARGWWKAQLIVIGVIHLLTSQRPKVQEYRQHSL